MKTAHIEVCDIVDSLAETAYEDSTRDLNSPATKQLVLAGIKAIIEGEGDRWLARELMVKEDRAALVRVHFSLFFEDQQ